MRELEDLNRKEYDNVKNDIDSIKQRLEELEVCNKQLGIMFRTLYDLTLEKKLISREEFRELLDKVDLSEWV